MFAKSSTARTESNSIYSSCNSSEENNDEANIDDEKYYSAKTSFDDFVEGKQSIKSFLRCNEFQSVVCHSVE